MTARGMSAATRSATGMRLTRLWKKKVVTSRDDGRTVATMPKRDPAELEKEWREALAASAGQDIADASLFYYSSGWYYIQRARRAMDGTPWAMQSLNETGMRERNVIAEIERLKAQAASASKE